MSFHSPRSVAEQFGYPDPAGYDCITCPYCMDARDQGMGTCLRHASIESETQ